MFLCENGMVKENIPRPTGKRRYQENRLVRVFVKLINHRHPYWVDYWEIYFEETENRRAITDVCAWGQIHQVVEIRGLHEFVRLYIPLGVTTVLPWLLTWKASMLRSLTDLVKTRTLFLGSFRQLFRSFCRTFIRERSIECRAKTECHVALITWMFNDLPPIFHSILVKALLGHTLEPCYLGKRCRIIACAFLSTNGYHFSTSLLKSRKHTWSGLSSGPRSIHKVSFIAM